MDAGSALQHLKQGRDVRREDWPQGTYIRSNLARTMIVVQHVHGAGEAWRPDHEDLLAEDWEFVDPRAETDKLEQEHSEMIERARSPD